MSANIQDWPPVPAGKVRLAEYGDDVPHSRRVELDERDGVTLWYACRGFEPAGSCQRFTEAKYGATWHDMAHGTTHGRTFCRRADARAYFDQITERRAAVAAARKAA